MHCEQTTASCTPGWLLAVPAGIFDMKWNEQAPGGAQLGLALSDGSIGILTPSCKARSLGSMQTLVIEQGTLSTCIDFGPDNASTLAVSTASGHLGVVQVYSLLQSQGLKAILSALGFLHVPSICR